MKVPEHPPDMNQISKEGALQKLLPLLLNDEEIKKYLRYVNDNYYSWEEIKRRPHPKEINLDSFWYLVKVYREGSAAVIRNFSQFLPTFKSNVSVSSLLQKKLHEIDMNCGSVLITPQIIPREDEKMYLLSSVMEEAIASSQLEGATTTRKVAKEMLKTKRAPRNNAERMILNNYAAMNMIIDMKEEKLSPEIIRSIQDTITKGTLQNKDWEGRFRDNDEVRVHDKLTNEILHTTPSFEKLNDLMRIYCDYANSVDEESYVHPIVKASILHFLLGYIHPFEDGNGRAARAIFYWYLISKGYWLFRYMSISRIIVSAPTQYAKAYLDSEQDDNDLTYFIKFQIRCIELAYRQLEGYIKLKQEEKGRIYDYLNKIPAINDRQAAILALFSKNPQRIVTMGEIVERFGVVYQTARTDLFNLVNKDFLTKKKTGKKYLFFRSDNFDLLIRKHLDGVK